MSDEVYRFQIHYRVDRGERRYVKFVADIRPHLHNNLKSRFEAMIELRSENLWRYLYSQGEVFTELWNAWEKQNKKLASTLPAKFPERLLALKKIRQKEFKNYSNPKLIMELWDAWCRENPKDAAKIEQRIKKAAKKSKAI
jgi:hypothetical protein